MTESLQTVDNSSTKKKTSLEVFLCSGIVALCPILQHYNGLLLDTSSDLFILLSPYLIVSLLSKKKITVKYSIPLIIAGLWTAFCNGLSIQLTGRELLLILFYISVENKIINIKKVMDYAIIIDMVATSILIIQYICYYLLGFHLQIVPTGLLKSGAEQWILLAKTGRISVTGAMMSLYRPSAFFLEPSHLSIYSTPVLLYLLTRTPINKTMIKRATFISLGVLLTTSGIGIVLCIGAWGIYFVFYNIKSRKKIKFTFRKLFSFKTLFIGIAFLIILVAGYLWVPIFRKAVNRIFIASSTGNNAVTARNGTGARLVKKLSGKEILFGKGYKNKGNMAEWNIAGLYYTYYLNGMIGVIVTYLIYFISMVKKVKYAGWLSLFFVVLSFVTVHTYAAFYRFFYSAFILLGWELRKNETKRKTRVSICSQKQTNETLLTLSLDTLQN